MGRRRLDPWSRLDGLWRDIIWPRTSLELVLLVVVMVKAAGVGVMMVVKVVVVWMLLLYPNVPQVPVLANELVHPPVQLLYPCALGLDETLLVLYDGGKLPQVQNRLHRVFQQAGAHHTQDKRREEKEKKNKAGLTDGGQRRCKNILKCG